MNISLELVAFAAHIRKKNSLDELTSELASIQIALEQLSQIDFDDEQARNNLTSNKGMALGTTWAATCLEDYFRTIQFVSGILQAIDEKLTKANHPIHILYAGTGPFATLLLPALACYTSDQIQCTLVELNPDSFRHMKKIIHDLGLEARVQTFVNADATLYEPLSKIDLLISETMQAGLMVETQVPIALHLSQFLNSDGVMIPKSIAVSAALISNMDGTNSKDYSQLQPLLDLNRQFCAATEVPSGADPLIKQTRVFEPKIDFPRLALMTRIAIYGNYAIEYHQSGLTTPLILHEFRTFEKVAVHFTYKLAPTTGFQFEIA